MQESLPRNTCYAGKTDHDLADTAARRGRKMLETLGAFLAKNLPTTAP
jgi:hypothetical protein